MATKKRSTKKRPDALKFPDHGQEPLSARDLAPATTRAIRGPTPKELIDFAFNRALNERLTEIIRKHVGMYGTKRPMELALKLDEVNIEFRTMRKRVADTGRDS